MRYTMFVLGGTFKVSPSLHSARALRVRQRLPARMQSRAFCLAATMENWKDIPGYEGRYQVSDQGRVRSLDALILCSGPVKGAYYSFKKGRTLRPGPSNFGHLSVVLGRNNTQFVHKLVLLAFVGPAPHKNECRHLNSVPTDNRLENLRWGTRSENNNDAVKHGTRGKLTSTQVLAIRVRLKNCHRGEQTKLAEEYGVSVCTINAIKFNRVYLYV